jgi:RNA polymerase sigma-70 factor (ECF subfamily)
MKNSFINNYRRMVKRNTFIDSSTNTFYLDSITYSASNKGEDKFMMGDIMKAINRLPAQLKETFMMNHEGYKYHEIADHFHIPIGTVKTRIFVARKLLKTSLKPYGEQLGMQV